ncbi:MAG: methyltransferase domain-containing protein, partial [Ruminococcus sp.]|nr:methyltransferase domain-containing protein [Ruminococcus sp.]
GGERRRNRRHPMRNLQRSYWNGLSAEYQGMMRISPCDFHYGPQVPGDSRLRLLPPLRRGMRVLELGCGGGQNSIFLAGKGLDCTIKDIIRKMAISDKLIEEYSRQINMINED